MVEKSEQMSKHIMLLTTLRGGRSVGEQADELLSGPTVRNHLRALEAESAERYEDLVTLCQDLLPPGGRGARWGGPSRTPPTSGAATHQLLG